MTKISTIIVHRTFSLHWPLTLTIKPFGKKKKSQQPFSKLTSQDKHFGIQQTLIYYHEGKTEVDVCVCDCD